MFFVFLLCVCANSFDNELNCDYFLSILMKCLIRRLKNQKLSCASVTIWHYFIYVIISHINVRIDCVLKLRIDFRSISQHKRGLALAALGRCV
jgi:hypothetical protein